MNGEADAFDFEDAGGRPTAADGELLAGDKVAAAYQAHVRRLLGLVSGVVGSWSLAEDIVQDVFVGMLAKPPALSDDDVALPAWLVVRARSRAIDLHRKEEARHRQEDRTYRSGEPGRQAVDDHMASDGPDLRAALSRLPANELEPILLAYFAGKTYREVAAALDVPEGTVKSRIRTGLRQLRLTLEEHTGEG